MITSFWFAIYTLFFVYLSINVIKARKQTKTSLGQGTDFLLHQAIRAHANFFEYTPMFLIGMYVCETRIAASPIIITLLALLFLAGRMLHFYALTKHEVYKDGNLVNSIKPRVISMGITFFCLLSLSALAIFKVFVIIIKY